MIKTWAHRHMNGDPVIWFVVIALSLLSILVVYSATGTLAYKMMDGNTEHYLMKHTGLVLISLAAMWIAHKIDYKYYSRLSQFALWASVPLLLITWKYGVTINEASRWLTIPLINQPFQPSDLAKLALIANLASMLFKKQQTSQILRSLLFPCCFGVGLSAD